MVDFYKRVRLRMQELKRCGIEATREEAERLVQEEAMEPQGLTDPWWVFVLPAKYGVERWLSELADEIEISEEMPRAEAEKAARRLLAMVQAERHEAGAETNREP